MLTYEVWCKTLDIYQRKGTPGEKSLARELRALVELGEHGGVPAIGEYMDGRASFILENES